MSSWARRVVLALGFLAVAALMAACGPKETGGQPGGTAGGQQGEIEAVKLIGAWVDAGAPEKDPFTFEGKDGKKYKATFEKDILPLFTQPNVWAPNTQACISCHSAVSEQSVHQMGLGKYEDIMKGADCVSGECVPIIKPGDWENSKLRARLRNNRMPPGVPFDLTEANRDGPTVDGSGGGKIRAVNLLGAWVDAGAPNGEFEYTAEDGKTYKGSFEADILPMFTKPNYWAENTQACVSCHSAVSENSVHQMGLGKYEDILKGADCVSGECVPIIKPGDWANSVLRARLRDNRMPPGMPFDLTEANRDGPVVKAGTLAE